MESINTRLKDLRYEYGKAKLSQEEMAEMTSIPRATIASNEKEGKTVSSDDIIKYCKAFNISADYLLGLTNTRKPFCDDVQALKLTDDAMKRLVNDEIDQYLLSQIIEHNDFVNLMIEASVFTSGYMNDTIKLYTDYYTNRLEQLNQGAVDADNFYFKRDMQLIDRIAMSQDDFFNQIFNRRLLNILKDIKTSREPRNDTSDVQEHSALSKFTETYDAASGTPEDKMYEATMEALSISVNEKNKEKVSSFRTALKNLMGQSHYIEPDEHKRRARAKQDADNTTQND